MGLEFVDLMCVCVCVFFVFGGGRGGRGGWFRCKGVQGLGFKV